MNEIQKILNEKKTENGDVAYKSTGNNLVDLFFMTPFFEKNLDQVKIGTSEKEKLFSMFIRDARFGLGRRDLGRLLMGLSGVSPENMVKAGRYDDLWNIARDQDLEYLKEKVFEGDELAKKWMPRLTGKDKRIAKLISRMWFIDKKYYTENDKRKAEIKYRKLIKTDSTVEYKLSYAESMDGTPLNKLFKKNEYRHPLVYQIDFEKVPSLAMTKYLHAFSTRPDISGRFNEYIKAVQADKAKVNVKTTNVYDAYKTATRGVTNDAKEVIANKIVDNAVLDVEMNAIVILDTSGSMGWRGQFGGSLLEKAMSLAYALSIKSTYAPNQIVSFSSSPQLMTIKGETLKERYDSMYTGDCSNTDFGAVMNLLANLNKYPEYLIVISDMEFDVGSNQSKSETMKIFKEHGADTKIIWWNLNDRHRTVPEFDEFGNIFISGYNLQILKLLENKFDMTSYIDKILEKYKKDIDYKG